MFRQVAFTLMGIEGIADEIEMPFGKFRLSVKADL
jgi:predicted membrane chloride channel (bestrophin family)